jgi:protein ImuB
MRLDQTMGRLAEPLAPPAAPPVFRADARLAEPVLDPGPFLPGLCTELCAQLAAAGMGARRLVLSVWRSDGEMRQIAAATAAPGRAPAHMATLFRDRLERIDPGFGIDLIVLEAGQVEPLAPAQAGLGGGGDPALELAQLVDRLTARFGPGTVAGVLPRASHIPERAETRGAPGTAAPPLAFPERPVRLLDRPEELQVLYAVPEGPPAQFLWRRHRHRVARYQGPERIAPEWWQDRPGTRLRDYFKVEDESGQRFWLYREGLPDDRRGGLPRWFLHGMFA